MAVSSSITPGTGYLKPNNRLGNKKTKTGCLTCKARKVKCDEAKPVCKRCVHADRICRGYVDVFVSNDPIKLQPRDAAVQRWYLTPPTSRSATPSPPPPPRNPLSQSSAAELRALQYYRIEVSNLLGGSVDPYFWTKSVLQLSEHEPAIKQALMAISTEWEYKVRPNMLDRGEAQRISIASYNKALRHTAQRLNEPGADTVALATCVLFLCLSCLQNDQEQANTILQSGSPVMLQVLNRQSLQIDGPESLGSMFLPIFERILVLLRLFGVCVPTFRTTEKVLYNADGSFRQLKTMDDARDVLYWLVAESHDLIVFTKDHRAGEIVDHSLLELHQGFQKEQLSAYRLWLQEFDSLCSTLTAVENKHYIAQLRLVQSVTCFWLATCLDPYEILCDDYNAAFEVMIENATEVIAYNNTCTSSSLPFTFEMGVIPPLYLAVLKCRNPTLRRQALDLLGKAPDREGLWRREEAFNVAQRVADLESGNHEILLDGTIFHDARISDVQMQYADELGTYITLSAKQHGSSTIWKVWNEIVLHQQRSSSDWNDAF